MITLFHCEQFFNFVSFLLYPKEVERLKCAMLGAFTVPIYVHVYLNFMLLFFDIHVQIVNGSYHVGLSTMV